MRTLLYLLTALTVMVLAFWAYRENYRTQASVDRMQAVQVEMAGLRERLGVLRAEWAYLNRPDRLTQLVNLNFDRLKLAPLAPGQFVAPNQLAYPAPDAPPAPDPLTGGLIDTGPSQNPGAPPRRPGPKGLSDPRLTQAPGTADADPDRTIAAPTQSTTPPPSPESQP